MTDTESLRRTAIDTLRAHAQRGGRCRSCGTQGLCPHAARAANVLDFLGDPPGWMTSAVLAEIVAALRESPASVKAPP